MALFEGYDRRIDKINNGVLSAVRHPVPPGGGGHLQRKGHMPR
jgi:hypothetical protein